MPHVSVVGCMKDEVQCMTGVTVLSFLQCFKTVGSTTRKASKGSVLDRSWS